jgi:hypothetical protein
MSNEELISKYVREAQQARLWGMLQLDFQDGQLTLIRREETFKVNRLGSNPHGRNAPER